MAKSKRNKKKAKKDRPMKASRLSAVERIERANQRAKADSKVTGGSAKPTTSASATTPAAAPPPVPTARVDPATARRIEQVRKLGLSVSVNATADKLDKLEAEFHLVEAYVGDVWAKLVGDHGKERAVTPEQLSRFAAELCGDGRLMSELAAAQRRREATGHAPSGHDYRRVAKALREHFADALPRTRWLGRLLGR